MPGTDVKHSSGDDHGAAPGYALRVYPIGDDDEMTLLDLWLILWGRRWLILSCAAIGAVIMTAASFLISPQYRAEVTLLPVKTERGGPLAGMAGQFGGLAALAGINVASDDNTAESMAVLRSRAFTEQFIERHGLLPVLFEELWDAANEAWIADDPASTPTLWRAYERFDKSIRQVTQDSETGLVTLAVNWTDPELARDWANSLVEDVNSSLRSRAMEQSEKSIAFLREQLQSINEVEMRTAVFGLMEAEMKNAMLSNVRTEFAFEVIDPAVAPERHHWPNRLLFAVLGLSAGLLGCVVWVLVRQSIGK